VDVPTWVWIATAVVTVVIFTFDLAIVGRRPHEPSMRECSAYLSIYVGLAVIFGLGVWYTSGGTYALEFYSGWLVEYSLSIDNLFIFIIIMSKFAVPRELQQYTLMVGIVMALVMRAIFIAVGAAAIEQFSWVFYVFGAFLIYTAIKLAKEGPEDEDEYEENRLVLFVEKRFSATKDWHGKKIFIKENGARMITPLFIVILTLGSTDLLFALDSIPAIFGITKEPYLVLTANIFALMGLRQLYFLIGGLLERLVYLSYGLAFLLAFIGVKLIFHALHENELPFINGGEHVDWAPEIDTFVSLGVIVAAMAVAVIASLVKLRYDRARGIGIDHDRIDEEQGAE
jgi:tellurite resistance protein TerC